MTKYQELQCVTEKLLDNFQQTFSPATVHVFKQLRSTILQFVLDNYLGVFMRNPNQINDEIYIIIATQCHVASTKTKNTAILKNLNQIRIHAIQTFHH